MHEPSPIAALEGAQRVLNYLEAVVSARQEQGPSEWALALEAHGWILQVRADIEAQLQAARAPKAEPPPPPKVPAKLEKAVEKVAAKARKVGRVKA